MQALNAAGGDVDELEEPSSTIRAESGFSSGERQIRSLQEIVAKTDSPIYLLDEWDANLDSGNRAAAEALIQQFAARARVVEISHRDRDREML